MDYLRRTWANIDLGRIEHNYRELKKGLRPGCKTMAVVKADAYGHGDGQVARALQGQGADWFAVSNVNEAVSLREQGIARPILILGYTPPGLAGLLAAQRLTQTVLSPEFALALSREACARGLTLDCHIKVDSGMSRIGFYAQHGHERRAAEQIASARALPGLSCTGIFTHFSVADELRNEQSRAFTEGQLQTFLNTLRELESLGARFPLRHCCNSAAAMTRPQAHLDLVRLGVALYGLNPSEDCAGLLDLRPAMSLYTTVTMVKAVEKGVSVSYGRRYVTGRDGQVVASVAVGYADGYRRSFSNRGRVIVRGQYAPIIGAVCMDQMMVDVTGIPDVAPGDEAILVGGADGREITLDDFAKINGTINYEEACLIGRRVPRVYYRGGKQVAVVDYVLPGCAAPE